jgi:ABC-type multidrug transport system fused ATPase/permease subunit
MNETSKITRIWIALALIWTALIFPGIVASFQVFEALPRKGFPGNLYDTILGWFLQPGPGLLLTSSVLGVLILLTLVTGIASLRQHYSTGSKALRRYLRAVLNENQELNPTGIAQPSQALISVNVPLDAIFIHLHAVSDRPLHDMPFEQQKALEELRQRLDLGAEGSEDNEERIARLKSVWASQLGQSAAELRHKQNVTIEDVMRDLTAKNPVAVLLGVPGSGKSTTMRWLALHMAQACSQPVLARWRTRSRISSLLVSCANHPPLLPQGLLFD